MSCSLVRRHLRVDTRSGGLFAHVVAPLDAFDHLVLGRRSHPHLVDQRGPLGLDENGSLNDDGLCAPRLEVLNALLDHLVHAGVHDGVQLFQLAGVAEHDGPQLSAVDLAVLGEHVAKCVHHHLPGLSVRRVRFVANQIGVYDCGPTLLEHTGNQGLSGTYTTGQADYKHIEPHVLRNSSHSSN